MKRTRLALLAALLALIALPATLSAQTPGAITASEAGAMVRSGLDKMDMADAKSGFLKWLGDILGMEVGTLRVGETQYSKVSFTPEVRIGRLKLGLYLPFIYQSDLFDPSDWYHPEGNDEWSFGSGLWQSDPFTAFLDALKDTALKIKYIEFGQQLEDPFFFKVGNLESLTIGHGLLMRNYRNNTEFPAVRRVGFNLGVDLGGLGFEALVNDLASPRLFGSRLYVRPIRASKLAFGVSAVLDTNPGKDLPLMPGTGAAFQTGDMMFLGAGVDMDLPIIPRGAVMGLRAYAGAAATMPWTQKEFTSNDKTISAGLKYDMVWNDGKPTNWGANAGLMGNILFLDWRAEYRYFTGMFKPSYFDPLYERTSGSSALEFVQYLDGTKSFSDLPSFSGIYGEAGFTILFGKLTFAAGYLWPFVPGTPILDPVVLANDKLEASLKVRKGLIPFLDLAGSISYTRRSLVKSILDGNFSWFDANSILAGELLLPVPKTPNLDIAIIFQTIVERDASGSVIYVEDGNPASGVKVRPGIGFETRVHF